MSNISAIFLQQTIFSNIGFLSSAQYHSLQIEIIRMNEKLWKNYILTRQNILPKIFHPAQIFSPQNIC